MLTYLNVRYTYNTNKFVNIAKIVSATIIIGEKIVNYTSKDGSDR